MSKWEEFNREEEKDWVEVKVKIPKNVWLF